MTSISPVLFCSAFTSAPSAVLVSFKYLMCALYASARRGVKARQGGHQWAEK
jgi:hypothetical protein